LFGKELNMRHLRDDTHLILDGEVRVYRRERSKRWQAAFVIDGHTIRISTGKRDVSEAKEYARDTYLEYKFRHKNDLPVVTKKFSDVARLAIADMRKQLDAGLGRKVYSDYIVCIERYLIPFFGAQHVTSIDYQKIQDFYEWRRGQMGREPKASTLNTHNSAMNRVFEEAVARGFLAHKNVPLLVNRGEKSERRPDFTREEYATPIRKLPSWINAGKAGKDLAPDPSFRTTVFTGVPFALSLDPGAINQQVQQTGSAAVRDVDGQGFLTARQRAKIGHRPIEANQAQQAFDEPCRLP
jgi:hypothetical protein